MCHLQPSMKGQYIKCEHTYKDSIESRRTHQRHSTACTSEDDWIINELLWQGLTHSSTYNEPHNKSFRHNKCFWLLNHWGNIVWPLCKPVLWIDNSFIKHLINAYSEQHEALISFHWRHICGGMLTCSSLGSFIRSPVSSLLPTAGTASPSWQDIAVNTSSNTECLQITAPRLRPKSFEALWTILPSPSNYLFYSKDIPEPNSFWFVIWLLNKGVTLHLQSEWISGSCLCHCSHTG